MLLIFNLITECRQKAYKLYQSIEEEYSREQGVIVPSPMNISKGIEGKSTKKYHKSSYQLGRMAFHVVNFNFSAKFQNMINLASENLPFYLADAPTNIFAIPEKFKEPGKKLLACIQKLNKKMQQFQQNPLPFYSENAIASLLHHFSKKLVGKNFQCTIELFNKAKIYAAKNNLNITNTNNSPLRDSFSFWFDLRRDFLKIIEVNHSILDLKTSECIPQLESIEIRAQRLAKNLLCRLTPTEIDLLEKKIFPQFPSVLSSVFIPSNPLPVTASYNAHQAAQKNDKDKKQEAQKKFPPTPKKAKFI